MTKGPLGVSVDETALTGGSLPQNQWSSSRTKPLHVPTILIVGGADFGVVELNEQALARLRGPKALEIVPGASHLFPPSPEPRATPFDDAPPIVGAGVRSRRCTRLRLAPPISAERPSVLLSRCYFTASALARPRWWLRRYQSFPLLKRIERAGRVNAWRSRDELDHLVKLGSAELSRDLLNASLMEQ